MSAVPPVPDLLNRAASRWPQRSAVVFSGGALSFKELERRVCAAALAVAEWTDASWVGLVPRRTWPTIVLLLALMRAGRTVCLLSPRWPPAARQRAAQQVDAEMPILDDTAADALGRTAPMSGAALSESSALPCKAGAKAGAIVFTSGTTAGPKAALLSAGNLFYSAFGALHRVRLYAGDRWLLSLPIYHVAGLGVVWRCMCAGAATVLPIPEASLGELMPRFACTHASMVPTQLTRVLNNEGDVGPSHLKAIQVGGAGVPLDLLRQARSRGYPVCTTYGLTESASQMTALGPDAPSALLATSGRILPYREMRIAEDGEILIRGSVRFQGYIEDGRLLRPFDAEGWFATGDVGHMDAFGNLHVEYRKDNMFISGGENIAPEAIERALRAIRGVERAIVVPVSDRDFGARPLAFVAGTDDWVRICRELEKELPRFMIPSLRRWPPGLARTRAKAIRGMLKAMIRAENAAGGSSGI